MGLRYLGNINKPGYNPLASNITTGVNVVQYQGIFTTQQQLQAITTGQWVTDPVFDYSTLLLQADGIANGSQNNTFLDSSTNNFTITRNGNTTQGTFSPFSATGWGNTFNGSGDYLSFPSNTAFNLGTGAYTVEAWIYLTAYGANEQVVFSNGSATGALVCSVNTAGQIYISKYGTGQVITGSSGDVPLNQWNHVAYVRSSTASNDTKLYVNGVLKATGTDSNNWNVTTTPTVGGITLTSYNVAGYLSNVRVVKGTAVYTTNFTPSPTPLTAITNTSLLTCQSNRFVDNSSNAFAVTVNGTPSVQAFSPFAPQFQYTASGTGGSGYFDGTGDYLSAASNTAFAFGTGDFTWEAWIYRGASATQEIYTTIATNGFLVYISSNKAVVRQLDVADRITSSADVALNTWTHIAVARSGTTMSLWLNGSRTNGGTATNSNDFAQNGIRIGISANTAFPFTGYISGMRVVKGTAVYDPTQTSITVPTAPPTAVTNTQLLLNFTNAGIYDGTMKNNLETVGNASVSTSVVKYGSGSMYFDGTGDWLTTPLSPWMNLGTSDFTMECWVYFTSVSSTQIFLSSNYNAGTGAGGWAFLYRQDNTTIKFTCNSNVSYEKTWVPVVGTWYHVAVSRANSNLRIFVNGIQLGTTSTSTDNIASASTLYVGSNVTTQYPLFGYMDDARITVGVARYTQNFTPPTVALPRQ
jgi:hypothetical protein